MLKHNKKGYYEIEELKVKGVFHGFSTVEMGSMTNHSKKRVEDIKIFAERAGIAIENICGMNQVHGNRIAVVSEKEKGTIITETDGLITKDRNIFLYGTFADCLPVLFVDKKTKMLGVVHAGWRGIFSEVVKEEVKKMTEEGSALQDILVGIGPSIRSCCFEVDRELAGKFRDKFPDTEILEEKNGKVFLDLQKLVKKQLTEVGIEKKNIIDSMICTKDTTATFFSYRARGEKKDYSVFAAMIGRYE